MTIRTLMTTTAFLALFTAAAIAENVEIYLLDMLDNTQNGYCVDIARAQGAKADPADGLQAHTCYSPLGELMVDQIFDTEQFADNTLFMPEFDVCMVIPDTSAGASVALAACDGNEAQQVVFSGEGAISPASAPDMCLTVAEDTRTGRSKVNQIKVLSLKECSEELAAFQSWGVRTGSE